MIAECRTSHGCRVTPHRLSSSKSKAFRTSDIQTPHQSDIEAPLSLLLLLLLLLLLTTFCKSLHACTALRVYTLLCCYSNLHSLF